MRVCITKFAAVAALLQSHVFRCTIIHHHTAAVYNQPLILRTSYPEYFVLVYLMVTCLLFMFVFPFFRPALILDTFTQQGRSTSTPDKYSYNSSSTCRRTSIVVPGTYFEAVNTVISIICHRYLSAAAVPSRQHTAYLVLINTKQRSASMYAYESCCCIVVSTITAVRNKIYLY